MGLSEVRRKVCWVLIRWQLAILIIEKMITLNLFYFNKLSNIQYFKELGHAIVENGTFLT